jgi:hypothetical protein
MKDYTESIKKTLEVRPSIDVEEVGEDFEWKAVLLEKLESSSSDIKKEPNPNYQDDELNILIYLLREYTNKKMDNSAALLRLCHQIYLVLFGVVSLFVFFYFYRSYALGFENSSSVDYGDDVIKSPVSIIAYIFLLLPSHIFLLISVVSLWTLHTFMRLKHVYQNKKIIDQNLAEIIRTTSQAREHVYTGFGKKVELEVRLIEAEDALENPRLYL